MAAFLGGIAVAFARDTITRLLKALADMAQRKFLSRRARHRRALRRYRARIRDELGTFRPPFDRRQELPMRDVYVPLRITNIATVRSTSEEDSGEAYLAIRGTTRAVVVGPPGAGKSMLLRHSLLLWASQRQGHRVPRRGTVPILIELHRANSADVSVRDLAVAALAGPRFPDARAFVDRALADARLELLLDGLDEVSPDRRVKLVEQIDQFASAYSDCRIVVTCRTAVYRDELAARFPDVFHIAEFDDRLIRRFLLAWPELPDRPAVDALMAVLHDAPRIRALAGNPLLLTMIAYLFGRGYGGHNQVLPHNRAEFYQRVVSTMLDDLRLQQNRYPSWAKRRMLTRLALVGMDAPAEGDRRELPREVVRATLETMWPDLDLPPEATVASVLDELVDLSGLLLRIDGGERFGFAHLTLQEHLAAVELHGDPNGLVDRFRRHPTTWREVVKLWCGSTRSDATEVLRRVRALDPVLALECLADVRSVDPTFAAELIDAHRSVLTTHTPATRPLTAGEDAVLGAFGVVAADRRPRGVEVFDFLVNVLRGGGDAGDRAAHALARTNTTAAADALAEAFGTSRVARDALVGMGDLAVHALAGLAREGAVEAVTALYAIGTPTAAEALVTLLWNASPQIHVAAAWQLASLVRNPDIEAALTSRSVPNNLLRLDWVWHPFADPQGPTTKIMGRVAWLIAHERLMPVSYPTVVDARVGMPLVLSRTPRVRSPLLSWTVDPPAPLPVVHQRYGPRSRNLGHSLSATDAADLLKGMSHRAGADTATAATFLDLIGPMMSYQDVEAALLSRLDLPASLIVTEFGLRGTTVTERTWPRIFAPRRARERASYFWSLKAIAAGLTLAGIALAWLSAVEAGPWWPSHASLPIAIVVSALLAQTLVLLPIAYALEDVLNVVDDSIALVLTSVIMALLASIFRAAGAADRALSSQRC
jgi:hypothetical protein